MEERNSEDSTVEAVELVDFSWGSTSSTRSGLSAKIGFWEGVGLVLGLQIGSGIFTTPGIVYARCKSWKVSLVIWIVGGLLAWTGAASYSELGTRYPRNGGTQAYLAEMYGRFMAFSYAWSTIAILKPGSQAIVATVLAEYFARLLGIKSQVAERITASLAVIVITLVHSVNPHAGARSASFFMAMKVLMLLFLLVLAIVFIGKGNKVGAMGEQNLTQWTHVPLALYGALWSYDGWDNLNFVSAEMKNAHRDLPRVLNSALPLLIFLYSCANLAYFTVLTGSELIEEGTQAGVSSNLAWKAGGRWASKATEVGVTLSCIGSINAQTFTSAHLVAAAANDDHLIPSVLGWHSSRFGTPIAALSLQAFLAIVYCWLSEFRSLITIYGAVIYGFYMLTTIGLARVKFNQETENTAIFTVPLILPLVFSVVAAFLIIMTTIEKPWQMIAAFGFIAAGGPLYYFTCQ